MVTDKYDICYGITGMVSRAFAIMWMNGRQEKREEGGRDLQLEQEKSGGSEVLNGGRVGHSSSEELPYRALTR
jgi:hypothetical protein